MLISDHLPLLPFYCGMSYNLLLLSGLQLLSYKNKHVIYLASTGWTKNVILQNKDWSLPKKVQGIESAVEKAVKDSKNAVVAFKDAVEEKIPGISEQEAEDAAEEQPEIKIETAPADFRSPTTNQTRHCFTRYIEYHRCIAAKGEDASECNKYAKYYRSLCPAEWVERWNEQRENGTFLGPL